jgi:hypothetical protein
MALTVAEKTWTGEVDNQGYWVLFGPPGDITPPTAPGIELVDVEARAVTVRVSTPSLDAQTGVIDYIFTANGSDTAPVGKATAEGTGYRITGLTPSTAYSVTAVARDNGFILGGPNVSSASNTLAFTTDAAPVESVFRNWPIMNVSCQQGDIIQWLNNTTQRTYVSEKDVVLFQWFAVTDARLLTRTTGLNLLKAANPDIKLLMYVILNETLYNAPSAADSDAREITKTLIEGPNGNSNWYVRRLNGDKVGSNFDPLLFTNCNTSIDAGVNGSGQTYAEAFFEMIDEEFNSGTPANFLDTFVDGIFVDVCKLRPPDFYLQGSSSTTVTDVDLNDDGVTDVRHLYGDSANAGGQQWEDGALHIQDTIRSQFPGFAVAANASSWIYDYFNGTPPTQALPDRASYGQWKDFPLYESVTNNIGITKATSTYNFTGGGGMTLHFRRCTAMERFLGTDSESTFGRAAILIHSTCIDRTPTANDYQLARTILCMALLMPRCAPCVSVATTKPMPLDELFLQLGNPLGDRSMGTLNEATLAWTLRDADYSSGVARFHWAEFEHGIVILRTDSPTVGVWPSADAAVACVLPSAGSGKKWQRINAATYVNPVTGYAMRSQDLTVNSGADVTSVSLKPYHGILLRRVNA